MRINSWAKFLWASTWCGLLFVAPLVVVPAASTASAASNTEAVLQSVAGLSPAEREKKLVEGAKKEGSVVWYTTDGPHPTQVILGAFSKKYPFIKPKFIRAKSRQILDRITTEARAGRHLFDLAKTSTETFEMYPIDKVFAKFTSPFESNIPANMRGERWVSVFSFMRVMGYNTNLVKKADLPKTWDDLLDPKWKGKILFDYSSLPEVATLYNRLGKDETSTYLGKLGASGNLQLRRGRTRISQLLVAGAAPLGVTVYAYDIEKLKRKGAPVDWALLDPTPGLLQPTSIALEAPHPYSAVLLFDFLLSKDGQSVYARMNRVPADPNVPVRIKRMRAAVQDRRVVFQVPGGTTAPPKEVAKLLDDKITKAAFKK